MTIEIQTEVLMLCSKCYSLSCFSSARGRHFFKSGTELWNSKPHPWRFWGSGCYSAGSRVFVLWGRHSLARLHFKRHPTDSRNKRKLRCLSHNFPSDRSVGGASCEAQNFPKGIHEVKGEEKHFQVSPTALDSRQTIRCCLSPCSAAVKIHCDQCNAYKMKVLSWGLAYSF